MMAAASFEKESVCVAANFSIFSFSFRPYLVRFHLKCMFFFRPFHQ